MTTVRAAVMVVDNWAQIYVTMIVVKSSKKSSSHLAKTATDALALMKTKAGKEDNTPLFYAQLLFLKAFSESFFNNAYDMAMRADVQYGRSSYGYTSHLCLERCYVMRKQLNDLLDNSSSDSWQRRSEFADYREAILDISELGDVSNGGREFFHSLPKVFLKTFVASYSKLVESCWRHWKILSYIVAGNPTLAQMYLNWLVIADGGQDMRDYCWPSKTIELEHHTASGETVEIDTRPCLEYLTEKADTEKILSDPLIKDNNDLLWQMAAADQPVNLFDSTTWPSGVDFEPLCDMIHVMIAPHMCQNQRIESYVQMYAVVAKTNVREVRRSARSVLHSTSVRPFNKESVEQKRSTIESTKDK